VHIKKTRAQCVYRIERVLDAVIPACFAFCALLWLCQAIFQLASTGTPFSAMHLLIVGLPMHTSTALNLCALYLVSYFVFRTFMPGVFRVVRAMLFVVLGVLFYDMMWSFFSIVLTGHGSLVLPLVSTVIISVYILLFNRTQQRILRFRCRYVIPAMFLYALTLYIFVQSGFFQQFALMEQGLQIDPHGWEWLLHKTVALWMWLSIELR